MLWPKRNSYKECDNEKNSCGSNIPHHPPPPLITFLMVRPKKATGLINKTILHAFLYISLPLLNDYEEIYVVSNFTFYGGRKQATTKFSFSL